MFLLVPDITWSHCLCVWTHRWGSDTITQQSIDRDREGVCFYYLLTGVRSVIILSSFRCLLSFSSIRLFFLRISLCFSLCSVCVVSGSYFCMTNQLNGSVEQCNVWFILNACVWVCVRERKDVYCFQGDKYHVHEPLTTSIRF